MQTEKIKAVKDGFIVLNRVDEFYVVAKMKEGTDGFLSVEWRNNFTSRYSATEFFNWVVEFGAKV